MQMTNQNYIPQLVVPWFVTGTKCTNFCRVRSSSPLLAPKRPWQWKLEVDTSTSNRSPTNNVQNKKGFKEQMSVLSC